MPPSTKAPAGVQHATGCPADPSRAESFEAGGPRGKFLVTRCQDCGEQTMKQTAVTIVEPEGD